MTENEAEKMGSFIAALIGFVLYWCGIGWMIHGFFSRDIHELCIGGFTAAILNINTHHIWLKKHLQGD
jgi:hypothetical protein